MALTRLLVEVARGFCTDRGYDLTEMSQGWLLRVQHDGSTHFIFGYDVGLNSSAASQLANDKSTTFEALRAAGIPAVDHVLFHSPRMTPYVSPDGNWARLLALFDAWNGDVVLKPHMGTGGDQVCRARSVRELEDLAQSLFLANRAITISPYCDFPQEFRVIVLDGEARLMFKKERYCVVGDGASTVGELAGRSASGHLSLALAPGLSLAYIPSEGETVLLEWRHNLGQGATPITVELEANDDLCLLSIAAMRELGLRFASVDIAAGAQKKVLEINAGVMLDRYAEVSSENRRTARSIYEDALERALQ